MKITTIAGIVALIAATGCAPGAQRSDITKCRDKVVTVNWRAEGTTRKSAYLKARPELVELCRNHTLTIRLRPPVTVGNASTAGPSGQNWLDGSSGGNGSQIVLTVPNDSSLVGNTYKYSITIDNAGTLDPRGTVVN